AAAEGEAAQAVQQGGPVCARLHSSPSSCDQTGGAAARPEGAGSQGGASGSRLPDADGCHTPQRGVEGAEGGRREAGSKRRRRVFETAAATTRSHRWRCMAAAAVGCGPGHGQAQPDRWEGQRRHIRKRCGPAPAHPGAGRAADANSAGLSAAAGGCERSVAAPGVAGSDSPDTSVHARLHTTAHEAEISTRLRAPPGGEAAPTPVGPGAQSGPAVRRRSGRKLDAEPAHGRSCAGFDRDAAGGRGRSGGWWVRPAHAARNPVAGGGCAARVLERRRCQRAGRSGAQGAGRTAPRALGALPRQGPGTAAGSQAARTGPAGVRLGLEPVSGQPRSPGGSALGRGWGCRGRRREPGVDSRRPTSYDAGTYDRLRQFTVVATAIAGGFALLMLAITYAISSNSIRTAVLARRDELLTMQLVGASRWLIRIRLGFEGALTGGLAGLIAAGAVVGASAACFYAAHHLFVQLLPGVTSFTVAGVVVAVTAAGTAMGSVSALFAFRRLRT